MESFSENPDFKPIRSRVSRWVVPAGSPSCESGQAVQSPEEYAASPSWEPQHELCEAVFLLPMVTLIQECAWVKPRTALCKEPESTSSTISPWDQATDQSAQSSTASAVEYLLTFLQGKQVYLKNIDEIRQYLFQFPDLIDVVPIAVDTARRYFASAQLVVDVYQDPEFEDRYLAVCIRLNQYNDFVEKFEKAQRQFLNHLADKKGWIQLTTDFRAPE
ncbi:MAG: hypothetical protein AB7T14_03135 [Candidatus Methylacidiphilaceae bacterium]